MKDLEEDYFKKCGDVLFPATGKSYFPVTLVFISFDHEYEFIRKILTGVLH